MVQSLSYMLSLAVLVVAQLATIANAQGEIINVYRWIVPYTGPKQFVANVGDTIVFRWTQSVHNVYIHPTMSCDLTGAIEVGQTPGTEYTFSPADGGTEMFFSCDIGMGSHCFAGQFITVTVLDNSTDSPTDSSTEFPAALPTEAPTDAPTDTPVASPTDAPVDPAPVDPAPVDPAPVDPAPVDPAPVDPAPVDPAPVDPAPVDPAPVDPAPVDPAPVDPAPVDPAPVDPAPVDPAPVDPANAMSISSSAGRRSVIDMALALIVASLALVVF